MPLGRRRDPSTDETISNEAVSSAAVTDDNSESSALFTTEEAKYSFEDIILNPDTYAAIQDVLAVYEKHDLIFNQWGLSKTHKQRNCMGINLYGAPGTGKTMAAHAIANQLNRKLLTVDYSQIESKYVGETSKNLSAMFEYAKKTNSIIFFDEADALLSKRVTNMSNATDVSVNQTRSVLLVLINNFEDILLFASNFISNYDPAFMRRILAHIKFELPDTENRLKLWKLYIPEILPTDVDLQLLSEKYSGISGADISNAVFTASLKSARLNEEMVSHKYFEESIERIIRGKSDNDGINVTTRNVSKEYVKSQFGGVLPK